MVKLCLLFCLFRSGVQRRSGHVNSLLIAICNAQHKDAAEVVRIMLPLVMHA